MGRSNCYCFPWNHVDSHSCWPSVPRACADFHPHCSRTCTYFSSSAGVDPALSGTPSSALESATTKAQDMGLTLRGVGGVAEDLPFESGSFDAVVSTLVFCSVLDPLLALREVGSLAYLTSLTDTKYYYFGCVPFSPMHIAVYGVSVGSSCPTMRMFSTLGTGKAVQIVFGVLCRFANASCGRCTQDRPIRTFAHRNC